MLQLKPKIDDRITFKAFDPRLKRESFANDPKKLRVVLAFLLTDALPFADTWVKYVESATEQGFDLRTVVHNKATIESDFVKKYELSEKAPTCWERTVPAHRLVVKKAAEMEADYVVWVCGATLPIRPVAELFYFLSAYNYSYFSNVHLSTITSLQARSHGLTHLPVENFYRHEQWYALHRSHFAAFEDDAWAAKYQNCFADNETYPLGAIQRAKLTDNVCKFPIMYTAWQPGRQHPVTYVPVGLQDAPANAVTANISEVFLKTVRQNQGCFFIRKVHPSVNALDYLHLCC